MLRHTSLTPMMSKHLEIPGFVFDPVRKRYFKITQASSGISDSRYSNSTIQKKKRLSAKKKQQRAQSNTHVQSTSKTDLTRSSPSLQLSALTNPYVNTRERHRLRLLGRGEYSIGNPLNDMILGTVLAEELISLRLFHETGSNDNKLEPGSFKWNWQFPTATTSGALWTASMGLFTIWLDDRCETPMRQYFRSSEGSIFPLERLRLGLIDTQNAMTCGSLNCFVVRYSCDSETIFLVERSLTLSSANGTKAIVPGSLHATKSVAQHCQARKTFNSMAPYTKMKAIGGRRNIPTDEDVMALRTLPIQDCAENKLVTCCLFKNSLITITEPGGETIVGGLTRKASDKVLLLGLGDTVELHVLYSRGTLAMFNWKLCTVEDEFLLGKLVGVPETIWYNELGTVVVIDNLAVRLIELGTLDHHHSVHSTFKSGYSELAVFRRNMSLLSRNNWCYQNQKGDYLIFYEGYNEAQEKACFMMINVRYQLMKRLEVDHCGQVAQFLYAMDPPRLFIVEQGQENGLRYKEGIPN